MSFWSRFPSDRLLAEASLWSADLTKLGAEIKRVNSYVDLFHVDVADNHFVPGLLFFPDLVAALRPLTNRPFHVHLMTDNPLSLIDSFADAGADMITIHCENGSRAPAALEKIANRGLAAGLALGLDVPLEYLAPSLEHINTLVLMGTPMGVKGKDLSPVVVQRIRKARELLADYKGSIRIEVDGGIRKQTVPGIRAAGAQVIVMGSLAFKSKDIARTIAWVRSL